MTFPSFQSSGKIPVSSDNENIIEKYTAIISLVFFNNLELILSTPADDESFNLSMSDEMPLTDNTTGAITGNVVVGGVRNGTLASLVNTDENAVLKILAQTVSLTSSFLSFVSVMSRVSCRFMISQNFLGLDFKILDKSL